MRVLETEEDLRWLAGGGDSTGFGVGRRWRQEDLGWPAVETVLDLVLAGGVEIGGYG